MSSNNQILMLTPFFSPNLGGVETHLDDLTGYLSKEQFNVNVITYQPLTTKGVSAPFHESRDNVHIYRLPWLKFNLFYKLESKPLLQFLYLFPGMFFLGFFYLIFNPGKTANIHGHGLAAAVATLLLSAIFRKKGFVSLHTIYKFSERPALAAIVKRILLPMERILVLAKGCKEDLIKIGIPDEKISTYTCWVDNKNAFLPRDKNECRKMLGLPPDMFIVLFVGRLSPEKGVSVVLDIVKHTTDRGVAFVLVGDGPMRPEVDETALKHDNLITVKGVSNDKLMFYYNASDILLFGSVDEDYYGRVTMEALSCGLPVILPDSTSYFGKKKKASIDFPQEEIGYLVRPQADLIALLLDNLSNDNEQLNRMKDRARSYALENFSDKNAG
ncbi:MAG TPA: glycosyltransferase, partial [Nitrospirae bacterium]|nr:glycosyltransferase [Nitrospirota bacterium]